MRDGHFRHYDCYYSFIRKNPTLIQGIPVVTELGLIPMKAKAWLDMTTRKAAGEKIDSKSIRKHRADVSRLSRLSQLIDPEVSVVVPPQIKIDVETFVSRVRMEITPELLKNVVLDS